MKKINLLLVAGIALSLMACKEKNTGAATNVNDVPVRLVDVKTQELGRNITVYGTLTTSEETTLSFKTPGIISRIHVKEGDAFRRGQVLAELDFTEVEAQTTQVVEREAMAKREYQRAEALYADSVISLEQCQNAQTAWILAKQALEIAEYNKTNSRIIALSNGAVLKRNANEGELTNAGSPIFTVTAKQENGLILKAGVSVSDWQALSTGDKATITLEGYPGERFAGTVQHLAQSADRNSGLYAIEIRLNPAKENISVGMFAKAEITSGKVSTYHIVPVSSISEIEGRQGVVYIPDGSRAKRIDVSIAHIENGNAFITHGLTGIGRVIGEGAGFISETSAIHIQQ